MSRRQWTIIQLAMLEMRRSIEDGARSYIDPKTNQEITPEELDEIVVLLDPGPLPEDKS